MAERLTSDELREIIKRDDEALRHSGLSQAARDRCALLGLLREAASVASFHVEGRDSDLCIYCRVANPDHSFECPTSLLGVLRD